MGGKRELISGMLVGAGAMYLLDPERAARRRSLLRDPGTNPTSENWPPATRAAIGTIGGLVAYQGARAKGPPGRFMTVVGLGLLARAAGNVPARRLVELRLSQGGAPVEKTIMVNAPATQVWELWSNFENFPQFMGHIQEVRKLDEGHSHWVAAGPAGAPVEWDAIVTDWVPQHFIGWTSVPGSAVETTGLVRLRPISQNETQIDIQLGYKRPAGAVGHALDSVLGEDPKQAIDEDLVRLKSLLENRTSGTPEVSVQQEKVTSEQKTPARKRGSRKRS